VRQRQREVTRFLDQMRTLPARPVGRLQDERRTEPGADPVEVHIGPL
jgi:hypothetical protein